ncbi:MAG: ATP-binding cassette domain-containing protein [Candidatus Firestonebacteria bacterium]
MIEIHNLTKKYKDIIAVDNISFDVKKGEIFGFLGPNGAGKTTTIKMLCTLLKPTSGTAFVNGYNIQKHPSDVRKSIGIIFQDPSLDERLTAQENLEFHGIIYKMKKDLRRKRIDEVLEMVNLTTRRKCLVRTFSGGMKRRLEIARGLMHRPPVLFLDEPTLGLDPQTRNHIWEFIKDIQRKDRITVILTTHYMDEAENCDKIAIINYGKIIALDTPDSLKKQTGKSTINDVFLELIGREVKNTTNDSGEFTKRIVMAKRRL